VHSDDGFALRVKGATFDSVNGGGARDDDYPEYMGYLTETGNSNTRGILKNLAAGDYDIEFIGFQRVAGSFAQIYAAPGAFQDDTETDQWQLIGAPAGLQIVAGPGPAVRMTIVGVAKAADRVTIDFDSTAADAAGHQLEESADLKSWQPVAGAVFGPASAARFRATVTGATAPARFYRLTIGSR
jgi:hypothetical protein